MRFGLLALSLAGCGFLKPDSDDDQQDEVELSSEAPSSSTQNNGGSGGGTRGGSGGGATGGSGGGSTGGSGGGSTGGSGGGSTGGSGSSGGGLSLEDEDCWDTGSSWWRPTDVDTADWDPDTGFWASRSCETTDLGRSVGEVATGSTVDECDDFQGVCYDPGGRDVAFTWSPPSSGDWTIRTRGSEFDTALLVLTDDCEDHIECDDDGGIGLDSRVTRYFDRSDDVVIVVDGYQYTEGGTFVLTIEEAVESDYYEDDDDTGMDSSAYEVAEEAEEALKFAPAGITLCECTEDGGGSSRCESL